MNMCGDSSMIEQDLFQDQDGGSIPTSPLQFGDIPLVVAHDMFLKFHYAHRKPQTSLCFGIKSSNKYIGAISFGKPASPRVCEGCCGKENSYRIYELNRLWISDDAPKMTESKFIGYALRKIKKERPHWIIVSYADTAFGHVGKIYQATNFIYTGLTEKRTDPIKMHRENAHNRHGFIPGQTQVQRSRKHRYFYFFNKEDIKLLKYPIVKFNPAQPKTNQGGDDERT